MIIVNWANDVAEKDLNCPLVTPSVHVPNQHLHIRLFKEYGLQLGAAACTGRLLLNGLNFHVRHETLNWKRRKSFHEASSMNWNQIPGSTVGPSDLICSCES